jgi:hypothetical protein
MLSLAQWGATVLAAAELNLYYIRRDVTKHLVEMKRLQPAELLPLGRWLVGTVFLIVVASVFAGYMRRLASRHRIYRQQLDAAPNYSGIREIVKPGGTIHYLHYWLFFVFPAFDVVLWALFFVGERLSVSIPW